MKLFNVRFDGLKLARILAALLMIGMTNHAYAIEISLYDGAENTLPDQQGWLSNFSLSTYCNLCKSCGFLCPSICSTPDVESLCALVPASSSQTAGGGFTNLNTMTAGSDLAGYFAISDLSFLPDFSSLASLPIPIELPSIHPDMPSSLNRAAGFTITFEVQILEEDRDYEDRAGFSLVVNTSDCSDQGCMGLEAGFWSNEIWVQGDAQDEKGLFYRAESAAFDTTQMTRYDLKVQGDNYELFAGGSDTPVLSGRLRDYSTYPDAVYVKVYQTPNFIFLGDDTESAKANINLKSVSIRTNTGDINNDGTVGLDDAILALQACIGTASIPEISPDYDFTSADVNGDGKIGMEEAVYILLKNQ
jgi:hypothetical protein